MWFKPAVYQNPNHSAIATTATTATKSPDNVSLSQKSRMSQPDNVSINDFNQSGNVAIVATGLSAADRQTLLDYLAAIGETDPAMIDEYLTECASKLDILKAQLQQAHDCLQIRTGDTIGMVQCSGCNHLSGDTCNLHGWRIVVDKWRRCSDFDVLQKTGKEIGYRLKNIFD